MIKTVLFSSKKNFGLGQSSSREITHRHNLLARRPTISTVWALYPQWPHYPVFDLFPKKLMNRIFKWYKRGCNHLDNDAAPTAVPIIVAPQYFACYVVIIYSLITVISVKISDEFTEIEFYLDILHKCSWTRRQVIKFNLRLTF